MSSEKTFSPLKLSVVAVAIVLVLNLVLRVLELPPKFRLPGEGV
ncbi:MAG: hypothetical protein AMXMBFR84_51260 [Candidatus Hydrogenedentota bacterium]